MVSGVLTKKGLRVPWRQHEDSGRAVLVEGTGSRNPIIISTLTLHLRTVWPGVPVYEGGEEGGSRTIKF